MLSTQPAEQMASQPNEEGRFTMNILHLDSSILGDLSVSRQLTRQIVDQLTDGNSDATVVHRELGQTPIAHLTGDLLASPRQHGRHA
jgi:FMN-dependent NADH-azoreductase